MPSSTLDLRPTFSIFLLASRRSFDTFDPFNFFDLGHFELWRSPPENSASYDSAGLVCALLYRKCRKKEC